MEVYVLQEAGYPYAVEGVRLNFDADKSRMPAVCEALSKQDRGHDKFLRQIIFWASIRATRAFWQEFSTYRIGIESNSQSTMHTLLKKPLDKTDFLTDIPQSYLDHINYYIEQKDLIKAKYLLPESYLQTRIYSISYAAFKNMMIQRKNHKLNEWQEFLIHTYEQLNHKELLPL